MTTTNWGEIWNLSYSNVWSRVQHQGRTGELQRFEIFALKKYIWKDVW